MASDNKNKMIAVGDAVPSATFQELTADGVRAVRSEDVFGDGKTVALFAVPGAFTPTCSNDHCPGFTVAAPAFKKRGVDLVCTAVNDAFVMSAWKDAQRADGKVRFLADGSGEFANATGTAVDLSAHGMGVRACRYAMIVKDGKVAYIGVEQPGKLEVSTADNLLQQLDALGL